MKRILLVGMCALLALAGACMKPEALAAEAPVPTVAATAVPSPTPDATPEPAPTATPVPTTIPEPEPTRITVMAVGDLMCLKAQLGAAHRGGGYSFDYAFAGVKEIISSADLAIGNLETLIAQGHPYTTSSSDDSEEAPGETAGEQPSEDPGGSGGGDGDGGAVAGCVPGSLLLDIALEYGTWAERRPLLKNPRINGPEEYLSAVAGAGFDVLVTANNHTYDYGVDGIQKTIEKLDAYSVHHTGTYASDEDRAPLIIDVQGIKIGILAYTGHVNGGARSKLIDRYDKDTAAAAIAAAKEAGADFTIVYMHWGTENTRKVTSAQKKMAQHLAEAGADLILGSHPHCVQEMALIETESGSVPVVYSLGNFISSMSARPMNRDGVIFKLVLEKNHVTGAVTLGPLSYIPTYCTRTDGGSFAVVSADAASAEGSSALTKSRERTIGVLGKDIAQPE
jgi:poly-gamma-glutamate capsule biosynthesis protein CapA/YwtB (metallophosphatase superfamily)